MTTLGDFGIGFKRKEVKKVKHKWKCWLNNLVSYEIHQSKMKLLLKESIKENTKGKNYLEKKVGKEDQKIEKRIKRGNEEMDMKSRILCH